MQRGFFIIGILLVSVCSSCAVQLKSRAERKRMDIVYSNRDSLNKVVNINDIHRDIRNLQDNSSIRITKYSGPDSSGTQAIDYVVEIKKDITQESKSELLKNETLNENHVQEESDIDKSAIDIQEKYNEPPLVNGLKQVKWIIVLVVFVGLLYRFRNQLFRMP